MSDDYDKWYSQWIKSWEQETAKKKTNKDYSDNIYSFSPKNNKKDFYSKKDFSLPNLNVEISMSVPTGFLEQVETALAKVNRALDNLLNYLHDKKNA